MMAAYAAQYGHGASLQNGHAFNGQDGQDSDGASTYAGNDERQKAFVDKLGGAAKTASAVSGIPARFILSHARARIGLGPGTRSAPPTATPRTMCSASRPARAGPGAPSRR